MAVVRKRRRSAKAPEESGKRTTTPPDWLGLGIFAALVTLAPLAFGAVDPLVQVGLLVLFAVGLALRPPSVARTTRRNNVALIALAAVLILKEFAPATLFGETRWRTIAVQELDLALPWTHHPEPGRAFDALLAGGLAILWLLWVRTLAGRRENRAWLAWALAGSAAIVSVVSFIMQTKDATAIYGLRYTPGWLGFGPFPNRNHTACFLAMGVVMSAGLTVWAIVKRSSLQAGIGLGCALLSLAGMLATQSRGGVLALSAGLAIYGGFCLAKFRDRRVLAAVVAIALLGVTIGLTGGSSLFARFSAPGSAGSNDARRAIWAETVKMWTDAPLFGHGAGSFTSLFPLYEHLPLDNELIIHPESSWLQWLAELGLIPLALAAWVAGGWLKVRLRMAQATHRSFFLYAAGFATCGALLVHSAVDVPAHRWATAAFALAALGLATPRRKPGSRDIVSPIEASPAVVAKRAALVPAAVAVFWVLPLLVSWPLWSPLMLLTQTSIAGSGGSAAGLPPLLAYFPLSADLHNFLGYALLRGGAPDAKWSDQFEIANRLTPGAWKQTVNQAQASARRSPEIAFHFWQSAVERAGARAEEIFSLAYEQTSTVPLAREKWAAYVEQHPALALEFVQRVPHETGAPYFAIWWEQRALDAKTELSPHEAESFYTLAPGYSMVDDFLRFMQARPGLVKRDFFACARVLHAFGNDTLAWQLLSRRLPEPELPKPPATTSRSQLERVLRLNPENSTSAHDLAACLMSEGDPDGAESIILNFAQRRTPPPFFTRKAAYLLDAKGRVADAVEIMLREASPK